MNIINTIGKLILAAVLWIWIGGSLAPPFRILSSKLDSSTMTLMDSIARHVLYFLVVPAVVALGLFWPPDKGWPWRKILRDALILSLGIGICIFAIGLHLYLSELPIKP